MPRGKADKRERILDYERMDDGTYAFYFRPPKVDVLPQDSREHFREAQRELLLAFRSLVEAAIHRGEEQEKRSRGARRIEVT